MPTRGIGESVPLVTSPPPTIALPWRAIAGPVEREGDELLGRAGARARRATASAPMKPVCLLAAPAEAGLDRPALDR